MRLQSGANWRPWQPLPPPSWPRTWPWKWGRRQAEIRVDGTRCPKRLRISQSLSRIRHPPVSYDIVSHLVDHRNLIGNTKPRIYCNGTERIEIRKHSCSGESALGRRFRWGIGSGCLCDQAHVFTSLEILKIREVKLAQRASRFHVVKEDAYALDVCINKI